MENFSWKSNQTAILSKIRSKLLSFLLQRSDWKFGISHFRYVEILSWALGGIKQMESHRGSEMNIYFFSFTPPNLGAMLEFLWNKMTYSFRFDEFSISQSPINGKQLRETENAVLFGLQYFLVIAFDRLVIFAFLVMASRRRGSVEKGFRSKAIT